MFKTLELFLKSWEYEAGLTQKVLNNLTDESLQQAVTSENWNLGRISWHIVTAIQAIVSNTTLKFDTPAKDYPVPTSAKFIADSYRQASHIFVQTLKTQWSDDHLQDCVDFFGTKMTNGSLLLFLIQHQNHHRGQMTVLMRQAGLTVPGIYGPSKEEWTKLGIPAPEM